MMQSAVVLSPRPQMGKRRSIFLAGKPGKYFANRVDRILKFNRLVRRWHTETAAVSSLSARYEHDAFRQIVSMGNSAVPLIIFELSREPSFLVGALKVITGEDPVSDKERGNIVAMTDAWLEWYEQRRWKWRRAK